MSVFLLMYMSVVVCYLFFFSLTADCEANYLLGDNKVAVNLGKGGAVGI